MIAEATAAYELLKQARGIVKQYDNAELMQVILDLQQQILSLQGVIQEKIDSIQDLKDQNRQLREQVAELENKNKSVLQLTRRDQVYWDDQHGDKDPFCPHCFEKDQLQIHLKESGIVWECTNCDYKIRIPGREYPSPPKRPRKGIW